MKTKAHFTNKRQAMLEMQDLDSKNGNVFGFALKLMYSLKYDTITSKNYDLLCGELQLHCQREGIETKSPNGVSLF